MEVTVGRIERKEKRIVGEEGLGLYMPAKTSQAGFCPETLTVTETGQAGL